MSDYDADAFDAFEAAGWGTKEAGVYDSLAGRVTSRLADALLDAAGVGPGTRVLDVATGPGYVAARATERGAEAVGMDLSESMLSFARSRWTGVEFIAGDATALPFADASFDGCVAAFLLLHLGRPERAVAEAARVVVSSGRVAFTVWDDPSRSRWLGVLLDAVADVGAPPPADVPPGPPFFRYADDTEFSALLTAAGLADVVVERIDSMLELEHGDELWNGLIDGTVRVGPLVRSQPEAVQHAVRARFDELLEEHRSGTGFEVPVAVKMASGRKP